MLCVCVCGGVGGGGGGGEGKGSYLSRSQPSWITELQKTIKQSHGTYWLDRSDLDV